MARLVYLGTPDAAVAPLQTLVANDHHVALVISRPDKRRGRGSVMLPSPVKAAALAMGLPVSERLEDALDVGAELGVVVAYGRIVPAAILDQLPMVNLHFSLLPRWRGAAPVERAILEGDAETGVCLMKVEAGLDTGPVYAESAIDITGTETVDEVRRRLVTIGCRLLEENLSEGVHGLPQPRPQVGIPTYAQKIVPAELELDWRATEVELARVVRLGRAWTTFRGKRLLVLRAVAAGNGSSLGEPRSRPGELARSRPGELARSRPGELEGEVVVAGKGTLLRLEVVQPEGSRPMDAQAWIRGVRPQPGDRLGE